MENDNADYIRGPSLYTILVDHSRGLLTKHRNFPPFNQAAIKYFRSESS